MDHFKHTADYIFLTRYIDKNCFGVWRAVDERRRVRLHNVRIHDGEVQVKFAGRWLAVEEEHAAGTDRVTEIVRELSEKNGRAFYAVIASVKFS